MRRFAISARRRRRSSSSVLPDDMQPAMTWSQGSARNSIAPNLPARGGAATAATRRRLQRTWRGSAARRGAQSRNRGHDAAMDGTRTGTRATAAHPGAPGTRARSTPAGPPASTPPSGGSASIANLLDNLIRVPGTGQRVGIDPLIGLIPVIGDLTSAFMSAWIVLEAARFKVPGHRPRPDDDLRGRRLPHRPHPDPRRPVRPRVQGEHAQPRAVPPPRRRPGREHRRLVGARRRHRCSRSPGSSGSASRS